LAIHSADAHFFLCDAKVKIFQIFSFFINLTPILQRSISGFNKILQLNLSSPGYQIQLSL